jgi:hypothetical protein
MRGLKFGLLLCMLGLLSPVAPFPDRTPVRPKRRLGTCRSSKGGSTVTELPVASGSAKKGGGEEVLWPPGYRIRRTPIQLLRGGRVVAKAGDSLRLGGGLDYASREASGAPNSS